jgi:hypothetical protein
MSKLGFGEGCSCVVGDFNVVVRLDERKGRSWDSSAMSREKSRFNLFI